MPSLPSAWCVPGAGQDRAPPPASRLAFCVLIGVAAACAAPRATQVRRTAQIPALIPVPQFIKVGVGTFVVDGDTRIIVDRADHEGRWVADYLSDLVTQTRGIRLALRNEGAGLELARVADASLAPEGYRLLVFEAGVRIEARETAGLFYGATTLWQLVTAEEGQGTARIPTLRIEDAPRFTWRGLMLDSARHFQSPEFIRRLIDVMALHRMNVLHWHLTDDQAWRIEILRYPRLTEVGAWRVPAGAGPAAHIDPKTGRPKRYGGFYTQREIRELVAYAADRHITVVPEIDMPGHATAAIVAYPKLGVVKGPVAVPADWGIYPNLFNAEEETFTFLQNVLREVMELFPSPYIHVGGDEAVKAQWKNSPRVQARMVALGVAGEEELQSYFIRRMERFLSSHGRRLIGWDEILEGGLAPNATVMSWRGVEGAVAAARANHDTVLAAWPTLYFDHRQTASRHEPPGRGRVVTLEDVYRFDVSPQGIAPEAIDHVLGVQANIWTEHIRTEDRVWRMAFPRAAAVAELAWSAEKDISWERFAARLPTQQARYRALGLPDPPAPAPAPAPRRRESRELETCDDKLVLALEDDAPVDGPRAVFLIDIMRPCWIWRDVDLSGASVLTAAVGQVPFNFQIGREVDAIAFRAPATQAGELEVRLGCEGRRIAVFPLAPAASNSAVTTLPPAALPSLEGRHDLCFTFTARGVDPMYAIDWVAIEPPSHE